MILNPPEHTIDIWINALHHYDLDTLHAKPDKDTWSLGQVYMHILEDTTYYIEQAENCLAHVENAEEQKTEFGAALFTNNSFPDERIAGDTHVSQAVPQPTSKNELLDKLARLKA